uniref:C-CAP/cofactor C-like domain-containing protein n=1 Tax=Strombidium rassoulzadegani TaxID=1082188 RepID=A0A7S3FX04_9SPIT|mmetsp:Transcript_2654/g.4449  ORF Transcript_2654/g.4449 Transcript_2654/m.4449 type:complete len:118 (+) Transcript_2654:1050-1403(+)
MMSRCKKVDISVTETMSMVEVIKSEQIKVRVIKKVPTVSVELCNQVQVYPTMESKRLMNLLTTASQSISVTYPKDEGTYDPTNEDEDPMAVQVVPETYHVKVDEKDKIVVTPQLGID